MKRIVLWSAVAVLVAVTAGGVAQAAGREGVVVGAGVLSGYEVGPLDKFGGGANLRVGYGFSDSLVVGLDNVYFYTRSGGTSFNFYDAIAKATFYPMGKNFYASTGAGMTVGQVGTGAAKSTKLGISTTTSVGYEFPLREAFALAVESGFNYKRLNKVNHYVPQTVVRADWVF